MRFPQHSVAIRSPLFVAILITITNLFLCAAALASGSGKAPLPATTLPHLTAIPRSLSFGTVQVGDSQAFSETLTNEGTSSITISRVSVSGPGFGFSGLSTPVVLKASQNYTFRVAFSPVSSGSASGNLTVVSNADDSSLSITLSGMGQAAGQLLITPASLDFGTVMVGSSASVNATLKAINKSVTVSSTGVGSPEFVLSGIRLPVTLSAGQIVPFTVTFQPQMSGTANSKVSFQSNASNSPTAQNLTGTGKAAAQHSVSLMWDDSQSQVVGYNVYRGNQSGGPYAKINSVLDANTTYIDQSVASGKTYYYVTTAVDSHGVESAYSNQAKAKIPSP